MGQLRPLKKRKKLFNFTPFLSFVLDEPAETEAELIRKMINGLNSATDNVLDQGWANYGPRDHFMRPAGTYGNMNLVPY